MADAHQGHRSCYRFGDTDTDRYHPRSGGRRPRMRHDRTCAATTKPRICPTTSPPHSTPSPRRCPPGSTPIPKPPRRPATGCMPTSCPTNPPHPTKPKPRWAHNSAPSAGGNHFVEVSLDEDDRVWVVLHSGSSRHRQHAGIQAHKSREESLPGHGTLPRRSRPRLSRRRATRASKPTWPTCCGLRITPAPTEQLIAEGVLGALRETTGLDLDSRIQGNRIDCHHNYAEKERHAGETVWGDPQRSDPGPDRRPGRDPRQHGRRHVHSTRPGLRYLVLLGIARSGPPDEPQTSEESASRHKNSSN